MGEGRQRATDRVDLSGRWYSDDYECPWGVRQREIVEIRHEGERLAATKLVGDDCVPTGFETFTGRLPHGATTGAIVWTVGTPTAPTSAQRHGYLKVRGRDFLEAGDEHMHLAFHHEP